MRFRASIENVPTLFRIIQAIDKLQKKCVIKFTEKDMHIICNNDANVGGIQVWSQIKVDSIFTGYRIQSNASNVITLSLPTTALLSVLRSASLSSSTSLEPEETVMKLAKKSNQAVLAFEISAMSRIGRRVRLAHDVKIEVMKPGDVEKLREPLCPEPDVTMLLPPLLKIRTIVDRLKPMSEVLGIQASNNGCLHIGVSTDSVKVNTQWDGLTNPSTTDEQGNSQSHTNSLDPDRLFSVLISLRSFLRFLHCHVVSNTTIASICQAHCLILYVYVGDIADAGGVLTFYIPAAVEGES